MSSIRSRCRHCGVRIRLVGDTWLHTWQNWQSYWCKAGGHKHGQILATHAEPSEDQ